MKLSSAVLRSGQVFIQGYSQTTSGVWIATGPVCVSPVAALNELSADIRLSLSRSLRNIRHPDRAEWKSVQRPMLQAVGVKSWVTLAKGAKAVGIECDEGIVTLTPSSNYADQGGVDLPDQAIKSRLDSDELGAKLVEAFEFSS